MVSHEASGDLDMPIHVQKHKTLDSHSYIRFGWSADIQHPYYRLPKSVENSSIPRSKRFPPDAQPQIITPEMPLSALLPGDTHLGYNDALLPAVGHLANIVNNNLK